MAKRKMREKEIVEHLRAEGFTEIKPENKLAKWYKKASKSPACLKAISKEKIKN